MIWQSWLVLICVLQTTADDDGVFAKALWFLHSHGKPICSDAKNDHHLKSVLAESIANDRQLSFHEIPDFVEESVFQRWAGDDEKLNEEELTAALDLATPATRLRLFPALQRHAAELTTTFDSIEASRYGSMDKLAEWIARRSSADERVTILTTCTGNSRRSILGAQMGNVAAAYYGFENVRFYSGGTAPSAFNPRTIATLQAIGFQIEPTGKEAKRGDPKVPNPIFDIAWGDGLTAREFSKMYQDDSNPQSGFAAILVCSEADESCPQVASADLRVSLTFLDPKVFDESRFETFKYAERRDDIGRTFLAVMANARRKIASLAALPRNTAPQL
ncbi:MAG: hypothetical protein JNK57_18655 [Planctomycetaceae bacterium]|nr:hypothetical protein [Planctomycetaceae bacterium]